MFPSQLFHFYSLQILGAISLLISLKAHFKQCIFSCTSNLSFKEKREKKKTSWAYLSYMTHAEYRGRWKHQICVERWRHCALSCISTWNRHKWHDCITFIHDALFNSRSPFLLQWFDGAHDWRHDATNCLSECAIKNDGGSLWDMKKIDGNNPRCPYKYPLNVNVMCNVCYTYHPCRLSVFGRNVIRSHYILATGLQMETRLSYHSFLLISWKFSEDLPDNKVETWLHTRLLLCEAACA